MGPETTQCRERVEKIAKESFVDEFMRKYPDYTNYTVDNVQVLCGYSINGFGKNINEFRLIMVNKLGCIVDTKSCRYSDY